jgi:hypothetical protein
VRDGGGALSEEQLERLARYFDEEVIAARKYKRTADNFPLHPE